MRTLEYGTGHEKTLLFLPCTAEPEWAFTDSVGLLSQDYHVMQIVYDGHGETGEDFISVETTVDEVTDWLQAHGITRLNAAYGCSLGGACLKTYSKRTVRNIFWSANNYTLPTKPAEMGCQITYWYGEEEKQARHSNICFIKQYFPRAQLHEIPKMDHAELVMMYPQEFYRRIMEFLTHTSAAQNKRS